MNTTAQTALVGKTVTVTLEGGQTEIVTVRSFAMKDVPAVLNLYPNLIRVSELAATVDGQPVPGGWADMLTVQSFAAFLSVVEEVNADFFGVCVRLLNPISRALGLQEDHRKPAKG